MNRKINFQTFCFCINRWSPSNTYCPIFRLKDIVAMIEPPQNFTVMSIEVLCFCTREYALKRPVVHSHRGRRSPWQSLGTAIWIKTRVILNTVQGGCVALLRLWMCCVKIGHMSLYKVGDYITEETNKLTCATEFYTGFLGYKASRSTGLGGYVF